MSNKENIEYGYSNGEACNRNGCDGIIYEDKEGSCSCHINPPCSYCTDSQAYCPSCNWNGRDEQIEQDKQRSKNQTYTPFKAKTFADLDRTKIDWIVTRSGYSTKTKKGVYPVGTTPAEVRKLVVGTFGGRFTYFDCGTFEFIAYTD